MLRQHAETVRVKGPFLANLSKDLAGSAHLTGLRVFQNKNEQIVSQGVIGSTKGLGCPL